MAIVDYTLDDLTPTAPSYSADDLFDTSTKKTGGVLFNSCLQDSKSNVRVVVVFSEPQDIYKIRVNNFHSSGDRTSVGAKNVDIYFSREEVTNEVFESRVIDYYFFGSYVLDEHTSVDEEDDQILDIYSWDRIAKPRFYTIPLNRLIHTFSPQIYPISLGEIGIETFDFSVPTDAGSSVLYPSCLDLSLVGIKGAPRLFWQVDPAKVKTIYLLTLTGEADGVTDVTLPISSCQIRRRDGNSTYMSVVTKQEHQRVQKILERTNGQLVLQKGVEFASGERQMEELVRVNMDGVRLDEGGTSYSVTLYGYAILRNPSPERVSLKDAYSISVEATGARRCRSAINLFLYPGDTVEVSGESYEVSIISYVINRGEEYMDVHEAR